RSSRHAPTGTSGSGTRPAWRRDRPHRDRPALPAASGVLSVLFGFGDTQPVVVGQLPLVRAARQFHRPSRGSARMLVTLAELVGITQHRVLDRVHGVQGLGNGLPGDVAVHPFEDLDEELRGEETALTECGEWYVVGCHHPVPLFVLRTVRIGERVEL